MQGQWGDWAMAERAKHVEATLHLPDDEKQAQYADWHVWVRAHLWKLQVQLLRGAAIGIIIFNTN